MSDPTARPSGRLHLETRCFVDWLQNHGLAEGETSDQFRGHLKALYDCHKGCDCQKLWNELFDDLFEQWVAAVRKEASGADLTTIVKTILGEEADEAPDARETLAKRIRRLREKIAEVAGEDEEFESDLSAMDKSLASYEQVLDEFAGDPRLDDVLRRGVKQALLVKERDFQWFEDLLERLRSERAASQPASGTHPESSPGSFRGD
jgi:hypothetical protein